MREKLDKIIGSFLVGLMTIMLLAVLWQVFTRYILGSASTFTEELARFLLIWIGLLGAAYASGKRLHLGIDLLPKKLTGRKKRMLSLFINFVIILFSITALVIGGGHLVYVSYTLGQTSAALQLQLAYVYAVIPISGLLIIYYKISDILKIDLTADSQTESTQISESNSTEME